MSDQKKLIIIGAGGLARELAWFAQESVEDWNVVGFCDDDLRNHGKVLNDIPVLGGLGCHADFPDAQLIVAIGNPRIRRAVVDKLSEIPQSRWGTIIHRSAQVFPTTIIGPGSVICSHVSITAQVRIGSHTIVNMHSVLGHDVVTGDFCTFAPLVGCSGATTMGDGVEIGMGATIRQPLKIGDGAMLGMGGVLTKDVGANELWLGNPAAYRRDLPAWTEAP